MCYKKNINPQQDKYYKTKKGALFKQNNLTVNLQQKKIFRNK